jgi:Tol biopolymer transport system component
MGEVYCARDTRLARDVAVKVLPQSFSADADRLRRFEQEACAAGALNHPNVLVVHDFGSHDGAPFLVSELLEGTTLREHLSGPPLPVRKAIDYALQIAAGLAAAHERGIVHRDLKPENLFVTRDGRVKILDFGLAKLVEPGETADAAFTRAANTEPGVVVGTAGYMSPEQVRGERIDHRSDIFSFGSVLYEMLCGTRPFTRDSAVETLHAILKDDPPDLAATGNVPPAIDRIVRHCLEKDADQRFQSARDVAFALGGVASPSTATAQAMPVAKSHRVRAPLLWILGTLVLAAAAAMAFLYSRPRETAVRVVRFDVFPPDRGELQGIGHQSSVIAPDGHALVLVVTTEGRTQLFMRALDSSAARAMPGTVGAVNPFWSPDSRWIGFFAAGTLKRVEATGGSPQTICNIQSDAQFSYGAWSREGVIVFSGSGTGLLRVSATGGEPAPAVASSLHKLETWPHFLPDGRHFLYIDLAQPGTPNVLLGSLDSREPIRLMRSDSRVVYAAPGYLLFVREGTLQAQPFDAATLKVSGEPAVVAENLLYFQPVGFADFSVSDTGILSYQGVTSASTLVWHTRDGSEVGSVGPVAEYTLPFRLSPDGERIAVALGDHRTGTTDLWLFDLRRDTQSRFTSDPGVEWTPVWAPDGRQIAFVADRNAPPFLHVKRVGDAGGGEALLKPTWWPQVVWDWVLTSEGQFIIYDDGTPATSNDLMVLPLSGDRKARPFLRTPFSETGARFSPDGKWVAYVSDDAGGSQVYVRPFERAGDTRQISTAGGSSPRWSRDGKELFYVAADDRLMAVAVNRTSAFETGTPKALFTINAQQNEYEVAPDGKRFLVHKRGGPAAPVTVVVNWAAAVRR